MFHLCGMDGNCGGGKEGGGQTGRRQTEGRNRRPCSMSRSMMRRRRRTSSTLPFPLKSMVDMGCNSCQMMGGIVIWWLVHTVQQPLRFSMQAPFIMQFIWLQLCSQNATVRVGRRFQEALFCPMTPHKQSGLTVHDKSRSLSVVPNTLGSSIGQITAAAAPLPKSRATHSERLDPRGGGGGGREKWVATVE